MSEKPEKPRERPAQKIETKPSEPTAEELDFLEGYLKGYPSVPQESPERCGEKILELEGLFEAYEAKHDLEALSAITTLTDEEAKEHPLRKPAMDDLAPMNALFEQLKGQDAVSKETYDALDARYKVLSRAVGIRTSNDRLDHTRG